MKSACEAKDVLYQHYNEPFIAGTRNFPRDHVDGLKLSMDDILNKTHRGRTEDAYYRSHHEIYIVIGHNLGGSVALALEKQYDKQNGNPHGSIQSKLSVPQLYQVVFQEPTLTELDGLGVRFLRLALIAPQLCHHPNKGLIIQLIVV